MSVRMVSAATGGWTPDFAAAVAWLSPELASRLQFGWAISVHILFASLSIGLAPYLVYLTVQEVRTGERRYARLRAFWTKVFGVGFVAGTVTGIPMGFMFGTNFGGFAATVGELIGGPLSFEVKMAFFLEAVALGVLLFGRERVSDRFYVLSSVLVGIGAWLSAFWVLVVNSWMQTPRGYELATEGGSSLVRLTDPAAAFLNPRLPWMYVHMQTAAIIAVTLLVAGVAAYFVRSTPDDGSAGAEGWRTVLRLAVVVLLVTSAFQVVHGDAYGRHVADTQPQKFAAMEAHYETGQADLHLVAIPTDLEALTDPRAENLYTISIPRAASFLASGGDPTAEVTGLNDYEFESPPVAAVFWSFRAMVGLGFWFVALGAWGTYRRWRGDLAESDRYLRALTASAPLGFVALLTGWYVTEIGRQPWLVQDVLPTTEGVSPSLTAPEATLTLLGFVIGYLGLLAAVLVVCKRLVDEERDRYGVGGGSDSDDGTGVGRDPREVIADD